ncbi:MAG: DUF721 domain-containing protein [Puniceicoccales bacterium]|jgi:predicted nucleic acid-binding Zn ribbon protein|nr:DUF721 domain-containing protein [Puniceicoccales bacterium]
MAAKKFNIGQRRLMADFCGIGGADMTTMVRMPQALGLVVSKAIRNAAQGSSRLKSIQNSWRGIVGEKIASFSKAKSLTQTTLTIEVTNRAVLQELKFNEQKILDALAKNAQTRFVKKLAFSQK